MGDHRRPYRTEIEIIACMLETAKEGNVRKTHFIRRCNLNHLLLKNYLEKVLRAKLIEINNSNRKISYKITQKGYDFLRIKREIDELFNTIDFPIPHGSATPYLHSKIPSREAQAYK